jgi:hypothetical protein
MIIVSWILLFSIIIVGMVLLSLAAKEVITDFIREGRSHA